MRESAETSNCLVLGSLGVRFTDFSTMQSGMIWASWKLGLHDSLQKHGKNGCRFCVFKKSSMHYLYAGLNIQEGERYLALIYHDRVVCSIDTLIRVAFPMVLRVVVNGLRLGHFNVFVHSVL